MEILADHCVSPSLVKALREKGFKITHAKEINLDKSPDEAIFNYGLKKSLVIFTFDHDFGNITKFNIRKSQGVVIIYREKMTKEMIFKKAIGFFTSMGENKLRGHLFIIESARLRVWPE